MSERIQVFKEPVVRIPIDKVRFPRKCPICGQEATRPARISAMPLKNRFLSPTWDPSFYPSVRRRAGLRPPETKSLLLSVCDDHYKSDEGDTNYKVFCLAANGILAAIFMFAILSIGGNLWIGRSSDPILYVAVIAFFVSILTTIIAFRAGPLAASIKIIGFDSGLQNIWLQFKRSDYRDGFMEVNAMNAELVAWIRRS
ncbi:MAG: hypothetical protein ACFFEF_01530 [Candidatus Thorarchaeota archaeon]